MVKPEPMNAPAAQRIEHAERFFAATRANIRHGGNTAYYAPHSDHIQMPPPEAFTDAESHAATVAHELTHWTKHESRLNRDLGRKRWGDEGYAREELVAEMGAAFLCADLAKHAGDSRRPRHVYRPLADGAEERQAHYLQRSSARAKGNRLPKEPSARRAPKRCLEYREAASTPLSLSFLLRPNNLYLLPK
jgi:hypothetical protein